MSTYVIWLDSDLAKIFQLKLEGTQPHVMHRHQFKHHTSADENQHKDLDKFHHEVAKTLEGATEILLMGPGLAKEHFKHHLVTHHHKGLASRVVGTETTDHLGDAQILARSREFFKTFEIFGKTAQA